MARATCWRASLQPMRIVSALALLACRDPAGSTPRGPPPGSSPPAWSDRPVDGTVLARAFEPTGDLPGTVECRSADDPTEVHTGSAEGEVILYGLLADTAYDCTLRAGGATEDRSFRTLPLPDWLPTWTMPVTGDAGGAYTLFNHCTDRRGDRQSKLLVVDPEGRLRWYTAVPYDAADLDASWLGEGQILYGGGYSAPPTVVDLSGRTLRDAPLPAGRTDDYHHDTEQLPGGEVLAVAEAPNTDGAVEWTGAVIEQFDPLLERSTWSWNTQRGVDEGWLPVPAASGDPYHTNSIQAVGDQLYVNFRYLSLLARIDRATGDLVWRLGPDGDFALVDETGAPDDPVNWFNGPHAPEHDGARILFYDNGSTRGVVPRQSRALELTIDEVAMTARVTWEFTEEGWYEGIWGDIDRLPDGNVLIARPHCGTCQPASEERTQLVEVDPTTDEVVWRLLMDSPDDAGYRAERIDGCELFANARYCP
jgi:hypothetical protein